MFRLIYDLVKVTKNPYNPQKLLMWNKKARVYLVISLSMHTTYIHKHTYKHKQTYTHQITQTNKCTLDKEYHNSFFPKILESFGKYFVN